MNWQISPKTYTHLRGLGFELGQKINGLTILALQLSQTLWPIRWCNEVFTNYLANHQKNNCLNNEVLTNYLASW